MYNQHLRKLMERKFKSFEANTQGIVLRIILIALFIFCAVVSFKSEAYFRSAIFIGFICMFTYDLNAAIHAGYIIRGRELISKGRNGTRTYPIGWIQKICYVDTKRYRGQMIMNRYQLAIYFDRNYIKSIEPLYFSPSDRDAFVAELKEKNPNIIVNTTDVKAKPFLMG